MAAITPSNATGCQWGQMKCSQCTCTCEYYFYYGDYVVIGRNSVSNDELTELPDEVQEEIFIEKHFNKETLREWRKLKLHTTKHRTQFHHRPTLKLRLFISKSGWLPRLVHKRKKGH